jgi:hypothetical protein
MGDWVAHPSNTVARRILVTYPLLVAVSGEGNQNFDGKPTVAFLSHLGSCKPKLGLQKWSLFNDQVQQDRRPASKFDLRARSICVCDFAYLVMKIWPHCNLVLMHQ